MNLLDGMVSNAPKKKGMFLERRRELKTQGYNLERLRISTFDRGTDEETNGLDVRNAVFF